MKTILHAYCYDIRNERDRIAYEQLCERMKSAGVECFETHGSGTHYLHELDGLELELDTTHLFANQWNTAPVPGHSEQGYRVFDWAQDYKPNRSSTLKRGHWLELTDEMIAARVNRMACGYCGNQQEREHASTFCPKCIDSEYLKVSDLHLTRMQSVALDRQQRAPLTEAELAERLPLYRQAQIHGVTQRGAARIAEKRANIEIKYRRETAAVEAEYRGFLWLMEHGLNTDNVIFYSHTGRFCWGWRQPIDAELESAVLEVISEFPYPYDLKCADGRTLSGN